MAGDLIWSRSNLTPLTSYCRVRASLSSQLPGINNRSIYWVTICSESQIYTFWLSPPFALLTLIFIANPDIISPGAAVLFPKWWMYLQIFLPSFVLSQLYNWPARASVSRVSAPRGGWNWSHYGDGITATSATQPSPLAAILKSQYWHCIEPSLSPYIILITRTE